MIWIHNFKWVSALRRHIRIGYGIFQMNSGEWKLTKENTKRGECRKGNECYPKCNKNSTRNPAWNFPSAQFPLLSTHRDKATQEEEENCKNRQGCEEDERESEIVRADFKDSLRNCVVDGSNSPCHPQTQKNFHRIRPCNRPENCVRFSLPSGSDSACEYVFAERTLRYNHNV